MPKPQINKYLEIDITMDFGAIPTLEVAVWGGQVHLTISDAYTESIPMSLEETEELIATLQEVVKMGRVITEWT